MSTHDRFGRGVAASSKVYIALSDYRGSAGAWLEGDAIVLLDDSIGEWLMREAAIAPAYLTRSPMEGGGTLPDSGREDSPSQSETPTPEDAVLGVGEVEPVTQPRRPGKQKRSTEVSEGGGA